MAKERRKVRTGRVIGDKMDKTVVVAVSWSKRHRIYGKSLRRITKFYAHDGENQYRLGDLVRIEETRPLSRMKRWRVIDLLDRREVADVKPIDLDEGILTQEADQAEELVLVEELDNEVEELDDEADDLDDEADDLDDEADDLDDEVEEPDDEVEEPDDEVKEVDEAKERDLVAELEEDEESLDEVEEPDADEEVDEIEESDVEEIEGAKKAEDEEMGEGAGQEDRS